MSEPAPTVIQALAAIAAEVREVRKEQVNTHGQYNFRGIDAVVNACGPAMRQHGVISVPLTNGVDQNVVQTSGGKPQTATRVDVTYRFYGPAGDYIDSTVTGESWDSSDKGLPQAYSVAYRICLLQLLTIPTDDPDNQAESPQRDHEPVGPPIAPKAERDAIKAQLSEMGEEAVAAYKAWRQAHQVPTVNRLTADQVVEVQNWIDAWIYDQETVATEPLQSDG